MCINREVSLIVFIVVTLMNIFNVIYFKFDTLVVLTSLILEYLALMQFIEFKVWQNPTCGKTNRYWSDIAMVANVSQPIMLFLIFILFTTASMWCRIVATIIAAFYFLYLLFAMLNTKSKCIKAGCGHLTYHWWTDLGGRGVLFYFIALIGIMFLICRPLAFAALVVAVLMVSLFICMNLGRVVNCKTSVPSVWCISVSILPFVVFAYFKMGWQDAYVRFL